MLVAENRIDRNPYEPGEWLLRPSEDNRAIFLGREEPWPLILDVPRGAHFVSFGELDAGVTVEQVRILSGGVHYDRGDYRRAIQQAPMFAPLGERRILRIAIATNERILYTPITLKDAGLTAAIASAERSGKAAHPFANVRPISAVEANPTRLVPPGAPAQRFAFRRRFQEFACDRLDEWIVIWESHRIPTKLWD